MDRGTRFKINSMFQSLVFHSQKVRKSLVWSNENHASGLEYNLRYKISNCVLILKLSTEMDKEMVWKEALKVSTHWLGYKFTDFITKV